LKVPIEEKQCSSKSTKKNITELCDMDISDLTAVSKLDKHLSEQTSVSQLK
jgi:hypothetical protein